MSVFSGPEVPNSGLILHLDAANPRSYRGSGTNWNDIAAGNTASLIASPTYSSGNNGAITFNGSSNYAEVSNKVSALEIQPTSPVTMVSWFKTNGSFAGTGSVMGNMLGSGSYPGYDVWLNSADTIAFHVISSWSANAVKVKVDLTRSSLAAQFRMIAVTYDGSCPTTPTNALNSMNWYLDGNLNTSNKANDTAVGFSSSGATISYDPSQRFRIASRWANGAWSQGSPVIVSVAMVYNRVISAAEVKQLFEAYRGRFDV